MNMSVQLKPMTQSDFEAYIDYSAPLYAAEKVRSGNWTEDQADELARTEFQKLFPQGLETPDTYIFCIQDGANEVGYLWISDQERGGKRVVWIYDIVIHEDFRRKGYATATFTALENYVRDELGGNRVELHVFGHNHGARALYDKLGFVTTNVVMAKDLTAE